MTGAPIALIPPCAPHTTGAVKLPAIPTGSNQNHQLSWWYALCLEGINTGSPTRALNEIYIRIKFTGYC